MTKRVKLVDVQFVTLDDAPFFFYGAPLSNDLAMAWEEATSICPAGST